MCTKVKPLKEIDVTKEEKEGKVRDVCSQAIWSLSSCKTDHGIEQLLDDSPDTFWQSDGPQPHYVNIQFRRKTTVTDICIYTDYKTDESYTPSRIAVRVGNHYNDLTEIEQLDLHEPTGWIMIPLKKRDDRPVRTFMVQLVVLANHQNGRDTHLRRIKLHSPVRDRGLGSSPAFLTAECKMFSTIR